MLQQESIIGKVLPDIGDLSRSIPLEVKLPRITVSSLYLPKTDLDKDF
jgi:hypothetical protein